MPATPIASTTRHFQRGLTEIVFATTVASKSAPSRAEINAGTALRTEIAELDGWQVEGEDIETPDLGTVFTGTIPGSTSADESSITFYADQGTADARTLLPRGTNGFILIMYAGDVTGRRMNVFPVRVKSVGLPVTVDDDPATVVVSFSVTAEPAENVLIPA